MSNTDLNPPADVRPPPSSLLAGQLPQPMAVARRRRGVRKHPLAPRNSTSIRPPSRIFFLSPPDCSLPRRSRGRSSHRTLPLLQTSVRRRKMATMEMRPKRRMAEAAGAKSRRESEYQIAATHGALGAALPQAQPQVSCAAAEVQGTGSMAQEQRHGEIDSWIWYDNIPHTKLVEYKKDQNWVQSSGDYLVFPGGETQLKDGVSKYIEFIELVGSHS
ncbi:uncharacterized protein LOC121980527 isoform X2 [Zingiber officinale]|uniref:uncharacterized protein LOC121980527 isoform X2 n=1 Tax=Zingiber officinale TaxID=94328 RepID=UPI001C4BF653|nr:uncharacterized protein LOC121980527 isoform X2 [Zingiber officinale]